MWVFHRFLLPFRANVWWGVTHFRPRSTQTQPGAETPFFVSEFTPPYNIGGGGVTEKRGVT